MRRIYYNISWGVGVSAGFITILHGGGGQANLLQYYMGGGSPDPPKLYYIIYEQPQLIKLI